jgi:hypothetical protein
MKVCPRTRPPHRAVAGIAAAGLFAPARRSILSPITVDDARVSLVGWRSTVSLQTVSGLDAAQLASTRLCVTPHPTTLVAGNPADLVRISPRACAGPGDRNEQEADERGRRAMDPTKKSCHADGSKDVIAPSVATGWSTGGDPHGAD